jgi:hypothetical protein
MFSPQSLRSASMIRSWPRQQLQARRTRASKRQNWRVSGPRIWYKHRFRLGCSRFSVSHLDGSHVAIFRKPFACRGTENLVGVVPRIDQSTDFPATDSSRDCAERLVQPLYFRYPDTLAGDWPQSITDGFGESRSVVHQSRHWGGSRRILDRTGRENQIDR